MNHDQLASIQLAEQLLPTAVRQEYVTRTAQCVGRYDYYSCLRFWTWPLLKRYNPQLPELPNFKQTLPQGGNTFPLPEFPHFLELFQQFPSLSLPQITVQFPSFAGFGNLFGIEQNSMITASQPSVSLSTGSGFSSKDDEENFERKICEILKNITDERGTTPVLLTADNGTRLNLFPKVSDRQSYILRLAESLIPSPERGPFISKFYLCLNDRNTFVTCTKTVIWPTLNAHILKDMPEFPIKREQQQQQQLHSRLVK